MDTLLDPRNFRRFTDRYVTILLRSWEFTVIRRHDNAVTWHCDPMAVSDQMASIYSLFSDGAMWVSHTSKDGQGLSPSDW